MSHLVFAYGSLIATPEYSGRVEARFFSELVGYRREFNKRSPGRGCPRAQAYAAFDDVPPQYLTNDWAFSLAVGTLPSDNECIRGVTLQYPSLDWASVVHAMDIREGYDPNQEQATLGYLRSSVTVRIDKKDTEAITYLSNAGGRYDLPSSTSLEVRAKILINGTPRPGTPLGRDPKVRGIGYLEQLRAELRKYDCIDPLLEQQAAAVLRLDGPWVDQIAPP
jgi:cation transport regulator ChaC